MQLKLLFVPLMSFMLYACGHSSNQQLAVQDSQLENVDNSAGGFDNNEEKEQKQIPLPPSPSPKQDTPNNADTMASPTDGNIANPKSPAANTDWDKKIIKTGILTLECNDYKNFNTGIHSKVKNYGAYIAEEKQEENDYKISNTISIKVPVAQFENLVNSLNGEGISIKEKNITSEDVTGEYVDTKSRLEAKKAVREKYLELLKQAKNMEEILKVQDEINSIQEDIEAGAGRVNYLQHSSAYSTINITYYQYINGSSGNEDNPGFFSKMSLAFKTGSSIISNIILFAISIWPLLIAGTALFIYLKRRKPLAAKTNQIINND